MFTDDKGKQGMFSAHLLRIKGRLFLDFFPDMREMKGNGFYQFHRLPVHTFVYVKRIEPTLQMSSIDPKWLKKHVADNPDAIRHEKIEGEVILTAGTKDLQAFCLKHLKTEGAFGDPICMTRKKKPIAEE